MTWWTPFLHFCSSFRCGNSQSAEKPKKSKSKEFRPTEALYAGAPWTPFFWGNLFLRNMTVCQANGVMQSFPSPTPLSLSPFPASPVSRLHGNISSSSVQLCTQWAWLFPNSPWCTCSYCLAAQILVSDLIHISDTQFSGELGCQSYSGKMLFFILFVWVRVLWLHDYRG